MEAEFSRDRLQRSLSDLVPWKQVAFMLSCCERMLPTYEAFQREAGWGNAQALRSALDKAWQVLGGENPSNLNTAVQDCDDATPDTEDFDSQHVSSALNAATSTAELVEVLQAFDQSKIVQAARAEIDSIDSYIHQVEHISPEDADREGRVLCHALMQDALRRQREAVELLHPLSDNPRKSIHLLRRQWRAGRS